MRPTALDRLTAWDESLLLRVRSWQAPAATLAMRGLTRAGDAATWISVSAGLILVEGSAARLGWKIAAASTIATALVQPLKRLCRRARPSHRIVGFTALVENPDVFSFPSGHTAAATAVAIAVAGNGGLLGSVAAALALGIGTSRVYLGAHYPLDVATGSALGLLAGAVTRALLG